MSSLSIETSNSQTLLPVDVSRLELAVRRILADAGYTSGEVSLAVVDDARIHEVNSRFLGHDYPTDVISFVFEEGPSHLEGEIVASAQTALKTAPRWDWPPADELLLYVIHGALHLTGQDDLAPEPRSRMRAAEARWLKSFGLEPPSLATTARFEAPAQAENESMRLSPGVERTS